MFIFRTSRSQMFFKIGFLKNFAILKPLSNKAAGLLLQNTCGGCFWLFAASNTLSQLNTVFIADSRTGFCSGPLWTIRPGTLLKRDSNTDFFFAEFTKFLRTLNLKSANDCFWNQFFHLDYFALYRNLRFRLTILPSPLLILL